MARPPIPKERMLEAAARALTDDPTASMGEIAKQARVGRATLHRHFASRHDLVCELTRYALAEADAACAHIDADAKTARDAIEMTVAALVPVGQRFGFLTHAMEVMAEPDIAAHYAAQVEGLERLVERAKNESSVALDMPTAWIGHALDAMIYAGWTAVRQGDVAPNDVARLVTRTLLDGVGPR